MLPKDANILFSLINMKLRDSYSSLDAFCDDTGESKLEIEAALKAAGYGYCPETNQFAKIK